MVLCPRPGGPLKASSLARNRKGDCSGSATIACSRPLPTSALPQRPIARRTEDGSSWRTVQLGRPLLNSLPRWLRSIVNPFSRCVSIPSLVLNVVWRRRVAGTYRVLGRLCGEMLASSDTIRPPTSDRSPQTALAPSSMAAIPTASTTPPIVLRRCRGVKSTKPGRIEPTGMEFEGEHHVVADVSVVDEAGLIALRSDLFAGS